LNSGFIKFITGRDSTTLRQCHQNEMQEFTANFITLLICNDIPECDDIDNAFSKRLRCVNFPTEFVMEPLKDNQKKIDVNMNKNFEYWKIDFILLLIEYYKKYTESQELKATKEILKWTNQYKEDTDDYLQFLNECTEENKDGHIHCSTLYEAFKVWFKINNPNTKIPSNKEFVNNLKKNREICKVKVESNSQLGIKNMCLSNGQFKFIHNESQNHVNAKNKCFDMLKHKYDVYCEYPLFYYDNTNTVETPISNILVFNEYIKKCIYPIAILDIACIKNNKFMFGIEIKYTHKVDNNKIKNIKNMSNNIIIYEVDADYINDNNIDKINEQFKIIT
jgi:phage/plasmid-associated DNA primase